MNLASFFSNPAMQFFTDNPGLHLLQVGLIVLATIVIFLLFFTLRDIILRTHSFWYQFGSIVLVALLPVLGFLIYLLIRPARTVKERELESMIISLLPKDAHHE